MTDVLFDALDAHLKSRGLPLDLLVVNTGGTFAMLPNEKGLLEPIQSEDQLRELLLKGLNLEGFIQKGLLNLRLNHLCCVDSSQMVDSQRDTMVSALHPEYVDFDGAIVIHGTDTGADTAKYLHLAMPYYDPRSLWTQGSRVFNWVKPVILLSSQVPSVDSTNGLLNYRIDSDGPMNFATALLLIADGHVGETGIITNNGEALRGTSSEKGAEVDIPPYRTDPAEVPIAKYTAMGMRYRTHGFLPRGESQVNYVPQALCESSQFSRKVGTVSENSHLGLIDAFLQGNEEVKEALRPRLPQVVIYVSKGSGNMLEEDYNILKPAEKEGVTTFRVPLPGGRIPAKQVYDVPGHDVPALNMLPTTAKYKAMMTLSLYQKLKIGENLRAEFIQKMMTASWGNEFLPSR
ncbi:hypothetical protein CMO91_05100 [Candidatus Woesearchaeota archaeon]|nr:hypothetical protein [Candidatus Woesearchaeota archaeon]